MAVISPCLLTHPDRAKACRKQTLSQSLSVMRSRAASPVDMYTIRSPCNIIWLAASETNLGRGKLLALALSGQSPFPRQSPVQPCALGAGHFARACVRQRYRRLPHTFDKNNKTPVPALASPTPQKSWTVAARLVIRAFHSFTNMIFRHMASWGVQGPTSGRMRYLVSRIQPMRGAAPQVPHPSC